MEPRANITETRESDPARAAMARREFVRLLLRADKERRKDHADQTQAPPAA